MQQQSAVLAFLGINLWKIATLLPIMNTGMQTQAVNYSLSETEFNFLFFQALAIFYRRRADFIKEGIWFENLNKYQWLINCFSIFELNPN